MDVHQAIVGAGQGRTERGLLKDGNALDHLRPFGSIGVDPGSKRAFPGTLQARVVFLGRQEKPTRGFEEGCLTEVRRRTPDEGGAAGGQEGQRGL
jgi:hypothetical protein